MHSHHQDNQDNQRHSGSKEATTTIPGNPVTHHHLFSVPQIASSKPPGCTHTHTHTGCILACMGSIEYIWANMTKKILSSVWRHAIIALSVMDPFWWRTLGVAITMAKNRHLQCITSRIKPQLKRKTKRIVPESPSRDEVLLLSAITRICPLQIWFAFADN